MAFQRGGYGVKILFSAVSIGVYNRKNIFANLYEKGCNSFQ